MKKQNKGITLLALVITIIILLILAGVSIASFTESGLFGKAKEAKKLTEIASIKEEIQTDIFAKQAENNGKISDDSLKEILEKYGVLSDEEKLKDKTLTTTEGNYEIKVSDIWSGTTTVEKILAKDVLKINPDATEDKDKSPYLIYNGLDCRVLYNDDAHGLQIITSKGVEGPRLGKADTEVSASDFPYSGTAEVSDDFKKAVASYNNAVDNLNKRAKTYMDVKGIAKDARCVGSIPTLTNDGKFQGDSTTEMWSGNLEYLQPYDLSGKLKVGDNYYEEDLKNLRSLDLISWDSRMVLVGF